MSGRLASRVIVVSGASSGIGRAVAGRIASEGGLVVMGARRKDVGEAAAREIRAGGGEAVFVAADVTVEAQAAALVNAAMAQFGRVDGAFNNAGGVGGGGPLQELDSGAWHADLAQNLTSVFYCMKAEIPAMLKSPVSGCIVNNASIAGVGGVGGMPSSTAAKHGVVGLTRSAALACASEGLRVNALVTGNVDSPLYRRLSGVPEHSDRTSCSRRTHRVALPVPKRSPRSSPFCSATKQHSSPARRWRSMVASRPSERAGARRSAAPATARMAGLFKPAPAIALTV